MLRRAFRGSPTSFCRYFQSGDLVNSWLLGLFRRGASCSCASADYLKLDEGISASKSNLPRGLFTTSLGFLLRPKIHPEGIERHKGRMTHICLCQRLYLNDNPGSVPAVTGYFTPETRRRQGVAHQRRSKQMSRCRLSGVDTTEKPESPSEHNPLCPISTS